MWLNIQCWWAGVELYWAIRKGFNAINMSRMIRGAPPLIWSEFYVPWKDLNARR